MSTKGVGSVAAENPKKRWSKFRGVGALVVIGLYVAGLTRLAVSGDWGDQTATRLFGITIVVASLLVLVSVGLDTGAVAGPRKRWTIRRPVASLIVVAFLLAGIATSIVRTGTVWNDPLGQLFMQTAVIGFMVLLIIDEPGRFRP
ncbi:hypothetical protein [Nocardia suismassiliense]|uniref:hypothetical protein n=1 Tax=Nocardia suismassiliense TaxID=2077092 RepID=UPI00131EDC3A|nr:hypothetical protein [Nocardia suismassiliense]